MQAAWHNVSIFVNIGGTDIEGTHQSREAHPIIPPELESKC
jgi:hypothetical protein